jgi:hypothetical protein
MHGSERGRRKRGSLVAMDGVPTKWVMRGHRPERAEMDDSYASPVAPVILPPRRRPTLLPAWFGRPMNLPVSGTRQRVPPTGRVIGRPNQAGTENLPYETGRTYAGTGCVAARHMAVTARATPARRPVTRMHAQKSPALRYPAGHSASAPRFTKGSPPS